MPRFFRVHSPGALPIADGESVYIQIDGRSTSWRRLDTKDKCFLAAEGRFSLSGDRTYSIERLEDGTTFHPHGE